MKTGFMTNTNGGLLAALILIFSTAASAQTTEFTYQGKLNDTGTLAATYDFQFRLCASETASCSPPLAASIQSGVPVSSGGNFTVKLSFGAAQFDGSDRFLEIAVKRVGETNYTTLAPRQKIASVPYAIQTLKATDALNLGGMAASQYVLTTDPRLSATNYVQNGTTAQPNVNFNIGGTGTANVLNAATQFNLGGERILGGAAGTDNLFAGRNSGAANAGSSNSFFGTSSGRLNTGNNNSFFGAGAGEINTGNSNSFFGGGAGAANTSGRLNAFFGGSAGVTNSQGNFNAFFGIQAGALNSTGGSNTFLGYNAGTNNSTGGSNTLIGANANVGATNLSLASAVGAGAFVTQSNSLVLGSINGVNGATADTRVGIGTTAPTTRLQITENSGSTYFGNGGCPQGFGVVAFNQPNGCTNYALTGGNGSTYINRPTGGTLYFRENNATDQMVIAPGGNVGIGDGAPLYKLDVVGSTNEGLRVRNTNAGGTIARFGSTGAFRVDSASVTGGRLSILENGNVGIGNSSPTARLEVTGGGTSSTALEINNGAIKVTGAGIFTQTPVFVVERTATNTCEVDDAVFTVIDNPYSNDDPNAILFVTTVFPGPLPAQFNATPLAIHYHQGFSICSQFNSKWVIKIGNIGNFRPLRFNVMIIKR